MNRFRSNIEGHISANQMQNYIDGKLSNSEMHEIEKHLLECDFCAEAMEGLELSGNESTFEVEVIALKNRISKKTNKSIKKNPFQFRRILAVAAMLTILVVVSVLVSNIYESNLKQKQFSENKKIEKKSEPSKSANDSNLDKTIDELEVEESKLEEEIEEKELEEPAKKQNVEKKPIAPNVEEKNIQRNEVRVVDDKVKIEPEVSEADFYKYTAEVVLEENVVMAAPVSEQYVEADYEMEQISEIEVTLDEFSVESKKSKSIKRSAGTVSVSTNTTSYPQIGINEYEKYLSDSLRNPDVTKEEIKKGFVILEFVVGKKGKIKHIVVIESLGNEYDKEAIRLLKEGPKWVPSSNQGVYEEMKTKIKVEF